MSEPRTAYRDERGHTHRHPTGSPFYHDECDITDAPEREAATPPLDAQTTDLLNALAERNIFSVDDLEDYLFDKEATGG